MKPIIAQIGNLAAKKKAHSLRARDSVRRASDFVQIAIALIHPDFGEQTVQACANAGLDSYYPVSGGTNDGKS
jgi:hypothetical protein